MSDERLQPYEYKGWMVYHYIGPQQFIATQDALVLRAGSKSDIERLIDDDYVAEISEDDESDE